MGNNHANKVTLIPKCQILRGKEWKNLYMKLESTISSSQIAFLVSFALSLTTTQSVLVILKHLALNLSLLTYTKIWLFVYM